MTRRPTWLAWLALLILLVGGTVAYMFSLDASDPEAHSQMMLALAITISAAGTCLIVLTADFWMRH